MSAPIDQPSRDRFVIELEKNFSVVAAAGSGKTRAITDRIVRIAQDRHAPEWLPQLIVVAFTNRAADEMQQRARAEILRAGVSFELLPAFNRAFFGTIHAFCVRLLETHGHHLGLPPRFDLITDDEELWNQFVQQQTQIGRSLSDENRRELLRHVQVRQLMELGRRGQLSGANAAPSDLCPDADFSEVYKQVVRGSARQNVERMQRDLRLAEQIWRESEDFVRWPGCITTAKHFVPIWREAFAPLRKWIDDCSLCVAAEVQRDYREFRLERGMLTYDDQVALALELLRHPEAARQIREKTYRVILDEAQDTDPRQFSLLLELARPPQASGNWLEVKRDHPRSGHFCMVGDFQQSIYRDRADLSRYRRIHETLVETGAAEALEFSVTFRLDTAQLGFVNATFREILNKIDNQVAFVELSPRPKILPGQVIRLEIKADGLMPDALGKISDARKAAHEARRIAQWLRTTGPEKLRARSWRDVAILCPRKDWLQTLRRGLRDAGFVVQVQSEKELKGDSPAYAWFTALTTIMTEPRSGYEIVGVLREVFGVSDHDLATFSGGKGELFQIETLTTGSHAVAKKLSLLAQIRLSILGLPLFTALQEIVRQTQLRERLRKLPAEDFEDLEGELESLLPLAAASESERMTLIEFADVLRTHFYDPREVRPSTLNAIQLITAQKAKGSEWPAVIVPFLTREVRPASPRYPRIIRDANTGEVNVVFDKFDIAEFKETLELQERQEMERLLYVALTRAQHTLVLALDHELFAKASGEAHSASQVKWLRADKAQTNFEVVTNVSGEPRECSITAAHIEQAFRSDADKIDNQFGGEKIDKEAALANASVFMRQINPSGLPAEEVSTDEIWTAMERTPASASPAIRYGVWWHEFIQQISWEDDAASWDEIFAANHMGSPDMARATREWGILRERISGLADFVPDLNGQPPLVHAEMPFFWRMDEQRSLEGVVDLALFDPSSRKWFIIDWKTNRVAREKIDMLRAKYRPQLAAYSKVMSELTGDEVTAAIYSTANAELLRYDADELAQEWTRLQALSTKELLQEIGDADALSTRARRG